MDYVEILQESRSFDITRTGTAQTIVLQFQLPVDEETGEYSLPEFLAPEFLGATDDILALEMAYTLLPMGRWVPNQFGDPLYLILDNLKLEEVDNFGWWKAVAQYKYDINTGQGGQQGDPETDTTLPFIRIGFSVGNKTKTITQSLELIEKVQIIGPLARPEPDEVFDNSIGVSEDNVEGAEVPASGLTLQITAYYYPNRVTLDFMDDLAEMSPSTNLLVFLNKWQPGEALFLGVDGSATVGDIIPLTFTIEIKKNQPGRVDPPFPDFPAEAEGHMIVDYRYVKALDEESQTPVRLPSFRYLHRGVPAKNWAALGFPGAVP